ncbi:uncharacterized protein FIBRA_03801 [Fibroporia radiculosa]|uniref:RRM domain-containing protein n=1 Tax=Fibroporia radiculosa TaxID=599839 RepID=J4GNP2_9APHY|nr:uncharacterized protein FIBRA_03801 [Fibroporia radiculosa]CCM01735.1 predicted protein [Fibroporia radiculosa]
MNVVREINKINERELDLGGTGSWHDDYKDSAYIFIGGLHSDLTEGDVITIFSQYGEVMDVNMPRDKATGKTRGFAFLMYEDQRSTILAVDNLNSANVLERTLRVDHVKDYKQPKVKGEDGEWQEREEQSFNAKPEMIIGPFHVLLTLIAHSRQQKYATEDDAESDSSVDSGPPIDPEDPMYEYLVAKRKEERALKRSKKGKLNSKGKSKHQGETPEERRARKERKKLRKAGKSAGVRGIEDLLKSLDSRAGNRADHRYGSRSPARRMRSGSRSPLRERDGESRRARYSPDRRRSQSRNRSPARGAQAQELRSHSPGFRPYDDRRATGSHYDRESHGHDHDRTLPSRRRRDDD